MQIVAYELFSEKQRYDTKHSYKWKEFQDKFTIKIKLHLNVLQEIKISDI